MNETFDKIFQVLNQGIAAINAAKQAESGTVATTMGTINPVQLTPEQRAAASSRNRILLWGGLALVAGLGLFLFLRRRRA